MVKAPHRTLIFTPQKKRKPREIFANTPAPRRDNGPYKGPEHIKVVCWKWDNGFHDKKKLKFGPDHVNRLKNMVARHLHMDHEFVCITDDPAGLDHEIRVIPLWNDYRDMGGCYVRLKAFSQEMQELIGERFIWLDLDAVIVGDITPIVRQNPKFMMWGDTHPRTPYNGSMVMMDAGSRSQVWTLFERNPAVAIMKGRNLGYVGTDQAWIGACLGRGEARWTIADGVYSYRCHVKKLGHLPNNARIVFFHGCADPSQPQIQKIHPWIEEHWR